MLKKMLAGVGAALALVALVAHADEAALKRELQAKFPKTDIESVTPTPLPGLYEVFSNGQIFYTDAHANYAIIGGNLVDINKRVSLTEERLRQLTAVNFSELPLGLAMKKVVGNGDHKLAYFADPNCPYCKKFEHDLAGLHDVTIYTFLYPVLGKDSVKKAKAVWCSGDRQKVWDEWMLSGVPLPAAGNCDTAQIGQILALGHKLNVTATPTLIFANGERVTGAISVAELEAHFAAPPVSK
ncbi:MAG TPA: DsbC family protein [Burkholderiales bacterium]|jgi:thiol:disulfide interchange protein DsbC|nr:DsbC family protein [Burkholderiales bacterium]